MRRAALLLLSSLLIAACGGGGDKPAARQVTPLDPATTGTVQVDVLFDGTPPAMQTLNMSSVSECAALHAGPVPAGDMLVANGRVQNAFVYIKDGLGNRVFAVPDAPVVFDQKGCMYVPHVAGAQVDQTVEFRNSDAFMHNVKSPEFNQGLATRGIKMKLKLANEGVMVPIRCDVHPWMRAFAGVMSHPYFDVTKADGAFRLAGLVDGEYTVVAWHEKLGTREQKVKVAGGAPASVDFELSPK